MNNPNGKTTVYQYNDEGQIAAIIENGDRKTVLQYDENENLASVQLPDGAVANWKYDALGNCIQAIDANGHMRQFQYDQLNRLCKMHLPDGNTIQLTYNAYDDIVNATDKYGNVQFEYTPLGQPSKRKQDGKRTAFFIRYG